MRKIFPYMIKKERNIKMTIDKMCDEVIYRYGLESKKNISIFRVVDTGNYPKILKAYQKIMR